MFLLGFAEAGHTQEKSPKVSGGTAAADKPQARNVRTAAAYESDESGIIAGLRRMLPREDICFGDIYLRRRRRSPARRWALVVRPDSCGGSWPDCGIKWGKCRSCFPLRVRSGFSGGGFGEDDGNHQSCRAQIYSWCHRLSLPTR